MYKVSDITFAQMRYFERAAALRSMTRAAAELHITQSAISTAIAQIERHVGASLFVRSRAHGLILTSTGEVFLADIRSALAQVDAALEGARQDKHQLSGRVSLACMVTLAPFILPDLLAEMAITHPGITVDVIETTPGTTETSLLEGTTDLGISYDCKFSDLITRTPLAQIRPYVLLAPGHALSGRASVHLRELENDPMILLDLPFCDHYFAALLESAHCRPAIRHRSKSYEAVRGLVARGAGFSILNLRPAHEQTYSGAHVATVEISDDIAPLNIVVAELATTQQSARVRAVGAATRAVIARWHSDAGADRDA